MKLTIDLLIAGYCQALFPMANAKGEIHWYTADPRAIIPLDTFHTPKRLARTVRSGRFEIRYDTAFQAVMRACAEHTPGRETTWISDQMVDLYTELHEHGFAHCVEAWQDGQLVGGLYGVAIRGLFAGESMFSRARDASKVCLVHLVERLRRGGYSLLDSQFIVGEHMLQFGTIEIPASTYQERLAAALQVEATW